MVYPKGKVVSTIISSLKDEKFQDIQASITGFESPGKITWKTTGEGYVPDVIASLEDDFRLYSVETKLGKVISKKEKEKWRLFKLYAASRGGSLYLVVSKEVLHKIQKSIESSLTNIKFITVV
jgi:hypothetical protein